MNNRVSDPPADRNCPREACRDDGLTADDLRWTSAPIPAFETVDLLTLDDHELLDYARSLQLETGTLRALAHEALTVVTRLTVQSEQLRTRIDWLQRDQRVARTEARDLRAQLRALTEPF